MMAHVVRKEFTETDKYLYELQTKISDHMKYETQLELLAEECTELAHACLKLARCIRDENPVSSDISNERLVLAVEEELADVILVSSCLRIPIREDIIRDKTLRWDARLRAQNKYPNEGPM